MPRPAWCPECAADYDYDDGDSAVCPACGYDAGGELVLFEVLADPATRRRKRLIWTAVLLGVLAYGGVGLRVLIGHPAWRDASASPGGLLGFAMAMWLPSAFVATMATMYPLCGWWLATPTTRRWADQARFGPSGWAARWRPGPVTWRGWWPTTLTTFGRVRGGVVSVGLLSPDVVGARRRSMPISGKAAMALPPGVSPGHVVALVRAFQEAATGTPRQAEGDEITHCPECGYVLAVPRGLTRPGRCPECGWSFGPETLVLYGWGGSTYDAAAARGWTLWRRLADKSLLVLAAVAFGVLPLGVGLATRSLGALPPLISTFMVVAFFVALVLGCGYVLVAAFGAGRTEREARRVFSEGQLKPFGPQQLRLDRDGFAQRGRQYAPVLPYFGEAALADWRGVTWRVSRGPSLVTLTVGPPARTRLGRLREVLARRAGRWAGLLRLLRRPVDFVFPGDRRTARDLRRRLRSWPAAREHDRGAG